MTTFANSRASGFASVASATDAPQGDIRDRSIGDIIRQANNLSTEQIEQVLAYQRSNGVKFGEAAVALGLARSEDVLWALAQQFHYPYAPEQQKHLNPELVTAHEPFSEQSESFRAIRSQIMMRLFSGDGPRRAISVLSPAIGDGKTFFAANLAVVFSQLGGRTLLIDADMRNPRLHEVFGLQDVGSGLSGILSGRAASNVIRPIEGLPSLFVLPVGTIPPNPLELVERPAFGLLIRELMTKFDYVIVDTPATVHGMDGPVIAAKCGAALVVARQNASRFQALQDLVGTLNVGSTSLCGVVVNQY